MEDKRWPTRTSTVQMDDGVELHVKVLGHDTQKHKHLLIPLHGAPGLSSLAEPEGAFAFLADFFRYLTLVEAVPPSTLAHIRTIAGCWDGAEKFVLAGGSYGGFITLEYAIAHGDRLLGMILRDTWVDGWLGTMTALATVLTSERIKVDPARQVRLWSGTLRDDRDFEEAIQEILPIYSPPEQSLGTGISSDVAPPRAFEGLADRDGKPRYDAATQNAAFGLNMPRFNMRLELQNIKVPTLVIVGRHDVVTPVKYNQEIAESIPHAELEIFEQSGHNPAADEAKKFQRVVLDFAKAKIL